MGLTKCVDCGAQMGDTATMCLQCGAKPPPKKTSSRATIAIVGLTVAAIGLMASRPDGSTTSPAAEPTYPRAEISTVARSMIRAAAKDADSLKFRNEFTAQAGIYCGEVNGKNSFGGYEGFKRFIANGKTVLFDDESTTDFGKAWREFCAAPRSAAG